MNLNAYCRLMRFDKPIGIYLLWFPTAWALWISSNGSPSLYLVLYFVLGTIVMRSAGCVINDIADRHIDKHVKRTSARPITAGEVSLQQGISLFILLLFAALFIVMQLPIQCFRLAILGLCVTIIYPFCKRWLQAPQLILGIAFTVAIPMVYTASRSPYSIDLALLMVINLLWVIVYDTMYAMVDREDDLQLGVKSTAILFYNHDRWIIFTLQMIYHFLWFILGKVLHFSFWFYFCWLGGFVLILYQQKLIAKRAPIECFKAFKSNAWYGLLMWLSLLN